MTKENKDLQRYKDAVWDYLLEHSDITEGGSLFVKFHTKSRSVFEGHVTARIKGYHRGDPKARQHFLEQKSIEHVIIKKSKKEKWKAGKEERKKILDDVKFENDIRKYPQIIRILLRSVRK